ncbi:MAG: hypothetical protein Q8O57_07800, partial [Kiritimatiellota bacterium]|nr:hypothetical protein [Kiritimatiellota bacterium]
MKVHSPNALLDLGMRALCAAMDALWVPPVFLHGPIRWGSQGLCGWRITYGADVCGDYERTASHCRYYAEHQGKGGLDRRPRASPETVLTRQTDDSVLFSDGDIVSWGVYNCTELWLNFLAHYYQWTGDRDFIRAIWPNIRRAVAYEKRVFDPDGDSLYENYANTYITDAHWHAGSGCVQASSYMYLGNRFAALAAGLVGESPEPFQEEAERIRRSMNRVLWLADKGVYAQWKDYLGAGLLHTDPELEAIYLSINNDVTDEFQTYQMLRFSEWGLPNDFAHEEGLQSFNEHFYPGRKAFYWVNQPIDAREMLTSNWRPIVHTVCESSAGGESMETARAYYRLGLCDRAWPLIQTMLQQMISRPTAGSIHLRGNVDFGDAVGTTLQAIVEGLFGVHPQMAEN